MDKKEIFHNGENTSKICWAPLSKGKTYSHME